MPPARTLTLGVVPAPHSAAPSLGLLHSDDAGRVTRFEEKPKDPKVLAEMTMTPADATAAGRDPSVGPWYQASMGIYLFNREVLEQALDNEHMDFGKHIIPQMITERRVHSYVFADYWEDIGTIRAFFDANLELTDLVPPFNFFDSGAPIYTRPRQLPASKINTASVRQTIFSDGCIVTDAFLERCVIGVRSIIGAGTVIRESVVMGADFYDQDPPPLRAGALKQCPAHRHRAQLQHPPRHHRQECPHRRRRGHLPRRQAGRLRRPQLPHSRRHRGGPEECRGALRFLDLKRAAARRPWSAQSGRSSLWATEAAEPAWAAAN